ncbi:hypothetical protein SAMN05216389_103151 [Oceanobacillus limi]|uniref:WD40-like Beta Propeller Repeat n=1 Tax=Oceanobacillus limi TaxID=930131 RepID=A0A1I0ABR1_9BACI|nr:hypothetical protein [Oceanobacillus limi]SES91171.1 hypothetical protein SAMN05216389_103151 [Oceanobacillus limi]
MVKKINVNFLVLFLLLLIVACSTEDNSTTEENDESNGQAEEQSEGGEEGEEDTVEPKMLFTYDLFEDSRFEFRSINSSSDGKTVTFSTLEEGGEKKENERFVIYGDKEAVNLKDISTGDPDDLVDRMCTRMHLSPNGKFVTFSCALDEKWFVVYDLEEEKIVHHAEELEDPRIDIIGITDNMEALVANTDGNFFGIYNLETGQRKEFDLFDFPNLEDEPYLSFSWIAPADNGNKFFMHNSFRLYVLDTQTEEIQKIADVTPYEERFKDETEGIILSNMKVSPNGNYVFYRLDDETSKEEIYQSHNFVKLEGGEKNSYHFPNHVALGTIDNNGNMVLAEEKEIYAYQFDQDKFFHIHHSETSVYLDELTLSADGSHLFYTDRIDLSEEQEAYSLFQLPLSDLGGYEEVEFNGTKEE